MQEKNFYIYGRNSIIEAINSNSNIEKIYVQYNSSGENIQKIYNLAKKNKITIVQQDKRKFQELEKKLNINNTKSQGVIALVSLINYLSVDELCTNSLRNNTNPTLVLLNEINDVHNIGAIARTALCADVSGLIIPERNSAPITPVAIKISAGALLHLPVAKSGSIINTLIKLKDYNFKIYGTEINANIKYYDEEFTEPTVIIIGNEAKGISPAVKKYCDKLITIPMSGKLDSLNASVSAGIILFEIFKQKSKTSK